VQITPERLCSSRTFSYTVSLRASEWTHWLDTGADVNPILLRESEDGFNVVRVR